MTNIILGCPYTNMTSLQEELSTNFKTNCINAGEITGLSFNEIYTQNRSYRFNEISVSFIRYPYDLIPPHSSSYCKRERTEFLKSLSLMFDKVSINPISKTWMLRNRIYSLNEAKDFGINVPKTLIFNRKNVSERFFDRESILYKSIGNCFVSDKIENNHVEVKNLLKFMEDDGDFAAVFLSRKMEADQLDKYLKHFQTIFSQEQIKGKLEFRVYVIGDKVFYYQRDLVESIDKSAAKLFESDSFDSKYSQKLVGFAQHVGLKYLCMDLIRHDSDWYLIDLNPFGSLPDYDHFPEPTKELASIIANS